MFRNLEVNDSESNHHSSYILEDKINIIFSLQLLVKCFSVTIDIVTIYLPGKHFSSQKGWKEICLGNLTSHLLLLSLRAKWRFGSFQDLCIWSWSDLHWETWGISNQIMKLQSCEYSPKLHYQFFDKYLIIYQCSNYFFIVYFLKILIRKQSIANNFSYHV